MSNKFVFAVIILATTGLITACSFFGGEPTPEPVVVDVVEQPRVVSAEAFVIPIREAELAFETGGRVVTIEVEEGDTVKAGDLLAQLDDSNEQARLAETEAGLAQAEASLAEAVARLAEAEANLAKTKAGPTPEEINQLQANLNRAQAALAERVTGPTTEDIAQAQASLAVAQAQLNEILASAREEDLQAAGAKLLQTQADVRQAQDDFDQVRFGDPDDVLVTGVVLEKATLAYEAAQAEYDKLVNGATQEQIATGRARVAEAQANLNRVRAGSTAEQIAQAQAEVERAEADLANLIAGATDEDIAIAEAQVETTQATVESVRANVEAAQAQVASAQVAVEKRKLEAPFDGQISSLDINEGEVVQSGSPVIALGDTSVWQIETDDLTEIDVVDVQVGAPVDISVDALPGEEYQGVVARVQPKSETKAGDVTYTVLIDITEGNTDRLRWGMTTFVDIEADSGIPR